MKVPALDFMRCNMSEKKELPVDSFDEYYTKTFETIGFYPSGIVPSSDGEDVVNHPKHYTFGNYEVLDVIEDWGLPYHLGNVIKYIARCDKKSNDTLLEDLKKAKFYLDRYISNLEKK